MTVTIKNLDAVVAGLIKEGQAYEAAAGYALGKVGLEIERQAKLNASTGQHKRGEPRVAGGVGPNIVSGQLRRSINTRLFIGFGHYKVEVGTSMIYARQVELGGGNWKSGVKYPYLVPALESLQKSGALNRIFQNSMRSKLGGK